MSSSSSHEWEVRSHEQDRINAEIAAENTAKEIERIEKERECYDAGYDFNYSFDIVNDYNFNCNKLEYINDHFVDSTQKMKSGEWSYRGFFSRGSGESYQYVTERILATGDMIKYIEYHVDCNDKKHNEIINYYTEGDAVMYYVDSCIV